MIASNQISEMMEKIARTADKHNADGKLKEYLLDTYTKNEEKMLSLEFWGNVARQYAPNSPEGKDVCLQEFGALGLKLGKEIKENQHNEFYKEAKENAGFERKRRKDFEKVKAMLMATADCGKV